VHATDGGTYTVVVSNAWGSDTSKNATLTIKNTSASASPVVYWDHNPVRSNVGAHFTMDIPENGTVTAFIADMAGDMVYSLIDKNTSFNPGVYRIEWHGQNVRQSFAGTGTYVYVFTYTRSSGGKATVIRKPVFLIK
jgi:flagellar hook assembly protein FlgD